MSYDLYWGEMHTHTYCCNPVPFGSVEEATKIAKTHLDFFALAEHAIPLGIDYDPLNKLFLTNWKEMKHIYATNYVPGKFVPIFGYEWGSTEHGDYNIYFKDEGPEEPLTFKSDEDGFNKHIAFAKENNAILIPHHGGYKVGCRGTNWNDYVREIMPLVEIFSMHGLSENDDGPFPMNLYWMSPRETDGCVLAGLERGIKIGFIASSDGHGGYPGCYGMGLLGAWTDKLTRESLWEAFLARRTMAITGDRISLNFSINGKPMGSEIKDSNRREILILVDGLDTLDQVDVIKNGRLWKRDTTAFADNKIIGKKGYVKLRIEWGWALGGIRSWDGTMKVKSGSLVNYFPCFGPPGPNEVLSFDDSQCSWISHTLGCLYENSHENLNGQKWKYARNGREGTNQIVFEIEGTKDTLVELDLNGQRWSYTLGNLLEHSHVEIYGKEGEIRSAGNTMIKFHRAVSSSRYKKKIILVDDKSERNTDYYHVRVRQCNGQMAWASPIWVNSKK